MSIIVKTNISNEIKKINKDKGYNVKNIDGSYYPELEKEVRKLIEKSIERARANNRRTLMGRDC